MAGKKGVKFNHEESKKFKEYYQKYFPSLTEEECIEKAREYNRSLNYKCIEFYIIRYPNLSKEECEKMRKEKIEEEKKNKITNILYWKEKYPEKSDEELEQLRSKAAKTKNKCNLEYWINKYPEKDIEELKKLHNEFYQSWLSHQEGWGKGDKNLNSKKKSSEKDRKSRSPRNIEFYIRKYPDLSIEECEKLREDFFKKNTENVKSAIKDTNIEYYLNQGLSEEDAKIALSKRQATFSLYKCIQKYGETEGLKIFNERQKIWNKKLQKSFKNGKYIQSHIANELFEKIKRNLSDSKYIITEKYIFNDDLHKGYLFDFSINDKLIEFNGDYWHANPLFYGPKSFIKAKNKRAEDIWEYDKIKCETASKQGFKVLTIWESEYKNSKEETIKKCIDFIKS